MEATLQPFAVGLAGANPVHVEHPPDGPGVDRRVEVGKLPLVGRELAVGVLELLEEQEPELVLGEVGVDQGERDALEGEVPGREPGVFPLVETVITRIELRCFQCWLRMCWRDLGGGHLGLSPFSHW